MKATDTKAPPGVGVKNTRLQKLFAERRLGEAMLKELAQGKF